MHQLSKRIIQHCTKANWFGGDEDNDSGFSDYKKDTHLRTFQYPPAKESEILAAEKHLGTQLPLILRTILLEVSNGHFGPGYGLYGVPTNSARLKLDMVKEQVERAENWWPRGLIPLCYFGCTILSAIYAPDGRIVRFDYSNFDCDYVYYEDNSLESWLNAWMSGDDMFNRLQNEALPKFP